MPVKNTEVEAQVIARSEKIAREKGISPQLFARIFTELIREAVQVQQDLAIPFTKPIFGDFIVRSEVQETFIHQGLHIGFQGEIGAYSHLCMKDNFPTAIPRPLPTFKECFDQLEEGKVDAILIPLDNSLGGPVEPVFDLLESHTVVLLREIIFKVKHHLIARHGDISKITKAISHPQALKQCVTYLRERELVAEEFLDTAGAVRFLQENDIDNMAAIASSEAARHYGLTIIESDIQDQPNNYTRFLLMTKQELLNK